MSGALNGLHLCGAVQVREYAKVFWERKDELTDIDRIMSVIDKGEQKIQRKKDIRNALEAKVDHC